jgi:hypothetical protein
MTSMSADLIAPTPIASFLLGLRQGSPILYAVSLMFLISALGCVALSGLDGRLIDGVSVWSKPAKFFVSLSVQYLTVSWALSLVPDLHRRALGPRIAIWVMIAAGLFEMMYILFRAFRGEASHFNVGTPLASLMYALMGIGALALTTTAAYIGVRIWRQRDGDLWREAAALGLILGAVLGTIAGGYMSSQTGHWVGGNPTDASGLGLFNWSTTGGDLRVAHFLGLHAAQFIPLAALSGRRMAVYASAAAITILTCAVFLQALAGIPFLAA